MAHIRDRPGKKIVFHIAATPVVFRSCHASGVHRTRGGREMYFKTRIMFHVCGNIDIFIVGRLVPQRIFGVELSPSSDTRNIRQAYDTMRLLLSFLARAHHFL